MRVVALAATAAATAALAPAVARAGAWMQLSCDSTDGGGAAVNSAGWDGFVVGGAPSPPSHADASCSALHASVASTSSVPAGAAAVLRYTPPAGSDLIGGYVILSLEGPNPASGGATFVSQGTLNVGSPYDQCQGTCGPYRTALSNQGGPLYIAAGCYGTCGPWGDYQDVTVSQPHLLLYSNSPPGASGFGGSLLQPPAHGTSAIAFTAMAPNSPGVYQVQLLIDGRSVYQGTPDTNGGRCAPVGTDAITGALMFDYAQPCAQTMAVDLPVSTTGLQDGMHRLQVIETTAAQTTATVLDTTISTVNRTTPSATSNAGHPSATASAPVYALRLDPASARLAARTIRRSYNRSWLALTGFVLTPSGAPAPGVGVTAQAQPVAGGRFVTIAHSTTDGAGRFSLSVPRGASRNLQLAAGGGVVALREIVTPNLSLRVRSASGGRLVFTGRLTVAPLGNPRPLVIIADRTSTGWQQLATVRVGRRGSFLYVYHASRLLTGYRFAFSVSTPATSSWDGSSSRIREAVVRW
jgi:hypothetical protein